MENMSGLEAAGIANLAVVIAVVLYGSCWLGGSARKHEKGLAFRYRAYSFWWIAWLIWVGLWAVVTLERPQDQQVRQLLILIASDANVVALLLVYFTLTRSNEYSYPDAFFDALRIAVGLTIGYGSLYLVFSNDISFALHLHEQWNLCMGVASSVLVGWAVRLRFNTRILLILGFIYALAQPVAYQATLRANERPDLEATFAAALLVLAFLKAAWATTFVFVLHSAFAGGKNLVVSERTIRAAPKWSWSVAGQGLVLLVILSGFVFSFMWPLIEEISAGLAVAAAAVGLLATLTKFWDKLSRRRKSGAEGIGS